ncbi:hypothetical protein ACJJIC_19100 [Microbulbifer sp. ANSA002]|uniref:hypothetical protein n=1 Tax=unclassified Microbulbifer TaxID=2619833 RepID=UPI0040433CFC
MASIKRFVERRLKLKVNDTKSQVIPDCFEISRQQVASISALEFVPKPLTDISTIR